MKTRNCYESAGKDAANGLHRSERWRWNGSGAGLALRRAEGTREPALFLNQRGTRLTARSVGRLMEGHLCAGRTGRTRPALTPCGTASRPICWTAGPTSGASRNYSAIATSPPRRFTPTSHKTESSISIMKHIRGPDTAPQENSGRIGEEDRGSVQRQQRFAGHRDSVAGIGATFRSVGRDNAGARPRYHRPQQTTESIRDESGRPSLRLDHSRPDPEWTVAARTGVFSGSAFDYVASMTYVFIQNDMTGLSRRAVPPTAGLQRDEPRGLIAAQGGNRVGCHSSREV